MATDRAARNAPDRLIEVCSACLTASCWHGEFMCEEALDAGTTARTRAELGKMNREHPDNYSDDKLEAVYGDTTHD